MKTRKMAVMVVLMGVLALATINCGDMNAWMQAKAQPWDPANAVMISAAGSTLDKSGNLSVALYDLDGNGTLDAIAGDGNGLVFFSMNQSTDGLDLFENHFLMEPNWNFPSLGQDVSPTVADIDGDGQWEVVVGNAAGEVKIVKIIDYTWSDYNWDNMSFTVSPLQADGVDLIAPGGYASPTFGDIDGNGSLDLILGAGDGNVYYYANNGDASNPQFTYTTMSTMNFGSRASVALIKLGDGDLTDYIVGNEAGEIQFCFTQTNKCVVKNTVDPDVKVATGDVNHDGITDIVYSTGTGNGWYIQGVPAN